jgi:hypothetical protein
VAITVDVRNDRRDGDRRRDQVTMKLTLLGTSSDRGSCPSVYATDQGTLVVQGWKITDPDALSAMDIPDHEAAVEIPRALLPFFPTPGA